MSQKQQAMDTLERHGLGMNGPRKVFGVIDAAVYAPDGKSFGGQYTEFVIQARSMKEFWGALADRAESEALDLIDDDRDEI